MSAAPVTVGYTPEQLDALVSCGEIAQGRIRGVLRRNGRLFAITGAMYGPNATPVYDACEAIPAALFPRPQKTYDERCREFEVFDATPDPDYGSAGERLRIEGRFYEGVRVQCKHEAFVLGRDRERWQGSAVLTTQGRLL